MTVRELHEKLSECWPRSLSCDWDNDGIMFSPDTNGEVRRVLIALDATSDVLLYAGQAGFDTVVTHHPMLFRGAKSVTPDTVDGKRILCAAAMGVSVISLHTRLDAGEGGVNDTLCRTVGFEPSETFGIPGEAPTLGRIAVMDEPITGPELIERVKEGLDVPTVKVTGPVGRKIRRIGFCGGDGKDFVGAALAAGCDAYLTGDAGYNAALDAGEMGLLTIEAGHFFTEKPVCAALAAKIKDITGIEPELFGTSSRHQIL